MTKVYCCRFHLLFVLMLFISTLSLVSHYTVDAAGVPVETQTTESDQQFPGKPLMEAATLQCSGLHGHFIINGLPGITTTLTYFNSGDITLPLGRGWIPATLSPPPRVS